MSERFIPIVYLPGPSPLDVVISADALSHYYSAQQIVASANEHSATILADLEQSIAIARDDVQSMREQARQAGMNEAKHDIEGLRQQTIADAVEWLIDEEQLERHIANNLDEWLRSLVTQAMAAWLDERNAVDDVMRRVKQSLESMADRELASIYVPTSTEAGIREEFSAMPRVRICTDPSLAAGQARLESRRLLIRFDLCAHRHLILDRLSRPRQEQ